MEGPSSTNSTRKVYLILIAVAIAAIFILLAVVLLAKLFISRSTDNFFPCRQNSFRKILEMLHCFGKNSLSTSITTADSVHRLGGDIEAYQPLSLRSETVSCDRGYLTSHRHRRRKSFTKKSSRNYCPTYSNVNVQKCQHGQKLPAYLRKHQGDCRLLKTLQFLVRTHYQINFPYAPGQNQQENASGCGQSLSLTEHCDALSQNNSLFGLQGTSLNDFPILPSDALSEISGNHNSMSNDRVTMDVERSMADGDSAFDCISIPQRDDITNPPPSYEAAIRRICTNIDTVSCTSEDYRRLNNQLVWATLCDCGMCDDLVRPHQRRSVCQDCHSTIPSEEIANFLSNDDDVNAIPPQPSTSTHQEEFVKIDFDYLLLKLLETCNQKINPPQSSTGTNSQTQPAPTTSLKVHRTSVTSKSGDDRRHVSYANPDGSHLSRTNSRESSEDNKISARQRQLHQSSLSLFQPSNLYPVGEYLEDSSNLNIQQRKTENSEDSMSRYSMLSSNQRPSFSQTDPSSVPGKRQIRLINNEELGEQNNSHILSRDGMSLDENLMINNCSITLNTLPDASSSQEVLNAASEIDSINFERNSTQTRPSIDSTRAMAGSLIVPMMIEGPGGETQINPETDSIIQTIISQEKTDHLIKQNIKPPSFSALKSSDEGMKPPPPYSVNPQNPSESNDYETTSLNFVPSSSRGHVPKNN